MRRTDTPMLREQLLAAIAAAPAALSTAAVCAQAPPVVQVVEGCHPFRHSSRQPRGVLLSDECHGDHHVVVRRRFHHEVYTQLLALERQGRITGVRSAGRDVHWQATVPSVERDLEVANLEALWRLPAEDPR